MKTHGAGWDRAVASLHLAQRIPDEVRDRALASVMDAIVREAEQVEQEIGITFDSALQQIAHTVNVEVGSMLKFDQLPSR